MIYTFSELLSIYISERQVLRQIDEGKLFKLESGLYSDNKNTLRDEYYVCKKYPNAILTGFSAFAVYDLTDNVPSKFYMATLQDSYNLPDEDIVQSYQQPSIFKIGSLQINTHSGPINIYDKERTLIELFRLRNKYPHDLYKEVVASFRKIKEQIDVPKLYKYLKHFYNGEAILAMILEAIY